MFEVTYPNNLPAVLWKNRGGLTREIAKHEVEGALIWRISIADVAIDGPFSRFPGLTRILTVIAGDGIDLHMPDGVMNARPEIPVQFPGGVSTEGRLTNGPIRDLNVIFDPTLMSADVRLLRDTMQMAADGAQTGILVLAGPVWIDGAAVEQTAFAFGTDGVVKLGSGAPGTVHHAPAPSVITSPPSMHSQPAASL